MRTTCALVLCVFIGCASTPNLTQDELHQWMVHLAVLNAIVDEVGLRPMGRVGRGSAVVLYLRKLAGIVDWLQTCECNPEVREAYEYWLEHLIGEAIHTLRQRTRKGN